MKSRYCVMILIAVLLVSENAPGQRHRPPPEKREGPMPERLERFKKMRMIEVLDLNEEDAVRFTAKRNAHEKKMREMMDGRREAVDAVEEKVRDKADAQEYQKIIDKILDIDQQMFAERRRFQDELRHTLTAEQFAKFVVFERNFEKHLRDAMDEMRRDRMERERD